MMHDLQKWSENEVNIKHRIPKPIDKKRSEAADNRPQTSSGVKARRTLALEKEKLNLRYEGTHQQTDTNIKFLDTIER